MRFIKSFAFIIVLSLACGLTIRAQEEDEDFKARRRTAVDVAMRELSSRDELTRQRAAEQLALYAPTEKLRLVEGYRLQEKKSRVRLALDWALYRMGKNSSLYAVVRELESDTRRNQAVGYLKQLPVPDPLYIFLNQAESKTIAGLLEALAVNGDAQTLELIKDYTNSFDPKISEAARLTSREITARLAQEPAELTTRPREVSEPLVDDETDETKP